MKYKSWDIESATLLAKEWCDINEYKFISITTPYRRVKDTYITCECLKHHNRVQLGFCYLTMLFKRGNLKTNSMKCPICRSEKEKGNLPTKYTKGDVEKAKTKYETLEEFRINEPGLYQFAHKNHIPLDCFKRIGNKYRRCIYSYTFILADKKYVYVGLTHDLKERHVQHCRRDDSQVFKFALCHNITIPQPKQETDYIDKDDASVQEKNILQNYIEKGYIPLNKATCGGLGGGKVINAPTEEEIREKAKDYTSVTLFRKNCGNLFYTTAKQLGILNELFPITHEVWSYDRLNELINDYITNGYSSTDFIKSEPLAYGALKDRGWKDLLSMFPDRKTKEEQPIITEEYINALFTTVSSSMEFKEVYPREYIWMGHHHIKFPANLVHKTRSDARKKIKYKESIYTFEKCQELAISCSSRNEFSDKYPYAYKVSSKNEWLRIFFGEPKIRMNYWNYETVRELALTCKNIKELQKKNSRAYTLAHDNGWLDEFFPKNK